MKPPSPKGTIFNVIYQSGREDKFVAKNAKHYEQCRKDLQDARKLGAVIRWTETNPKAKEVKYHG